MGLNHRRKKSPHGFLTKPSLTTRTAIFQSGASGKTLPKWAGFRQLCSCCAPTLGHELRGNSVWDPSCRAGRVVKRSLVCPLNLFHLEALSCIYSSRCLPPQRILVCAVTFAAVSEATHALQLGCRHIAVLPRVRQCPYTAHIGSVYRLT